MKKLLFYASAVAVLFSSCSKDASEDVATQVGGNKIFTASMGADVESTRLHLEGATYVWDAADGIGIASADVEDANIPTYTTEESTNPTFYVSADDYRYLFNDVEIIGKPVYAYYPYSPAQSKFNVDADGVASINLAIPATQKYAGSSFYKTSINAVGYVEEYAENAEIEMTIPTAILRFNVLGLGETAETGVSLQIMNKYDKFYNLNGSADVKLNAVDTEENLVAPALELDQSAIGTDGTVATTKNTVVFGSVAEEFDYYDSIPVAFVVPAGLDLSEATIILSNGTDTFKYEMPAAPAENPTMYYTKPDMYRNFTSFNVQFGLDDYFVITNGDNDEAVRDFILYAFATQDDYIFNRGISDLYPTMDDANTLKDFMDFDDVADVLKLKLLIARETIDFTDFDAEAMYTYYGTSQYNGDAMAALYRKALLWYIQNENAIETFDAEKSAVVGGFPNPSEIIGLNVLGNGITEETAIDNIKFSNTKVIATEENKPAGFVMSEASTASVKKIVLGNGNQLIATGAGNNYVGGIVGSLQTHNSKLENITVEALPTIVTTLSLDETSIGQLYGYFGVKSNVVVDLEAYKVSSLDAPAFYMVETASANPSVLEINNIPAGATYSSVFATNHSVRPAAIVADGTSYWSGVVYASVGGDDYFTAEELAYILSNNAVTTIDIAMTHNIDMQNIEFTHSASGSLKASVINEKAYEIANVAAKYNGNGYIGLFGMESKLENLELSNIVMNVTSSHNTLGDKIGGLAIAGTATDVVVNGLTLNLPNSGTAVTAPKYIGGVFATIDTDDIDNVEVKSFKVNYAGEQTLNASVGVIAGKLKVTPTVKVPSVDLKITTLSGAKTAYLFSGNYAGQQTRALNETDVYKVDNCYANKYLYTYGVIEVTNPEFGASKSTAWLNVNADSKSWTERIAAGIVFNFADWTDVDTTVGHDAAVDYGYKFVLNKEVNKSWNVWGFTPAE